MGIKEYLDDAIKNRKSVTIKYIKYGGEYSERKISNIEYSDEFGSEYIQAFCHKRQENRTFKISRILSIDNIIGTSVNTCSTQKTEKSVYVGNTSSVELKSTIKSSSYASNSKVSSLSTSAYKSTSSTSKNNCLPQSKKSSEGCYIATMVYGDYNHPQVLVLRRYRDEVLLKSIIGKLFVNFYYYVSPKLVTLFRNKEKINRLIFLFLEFFISKIKKI